MNQQLTNLLAQLAAKLGTTIQYLWGVEVRQAYVAACQNLMWSVLFLIVGIVSGWLVKKYWIAYHDTSEGLYIFVIVVGVLLFIVSAIVVISCSINAVGIFLNPQYWAWQDILGAVTPSSN